MQGHRKARIRAGRLRSLQIHIISLDSTRGCCRNQSAAASLRCKLIIRGMLDHFRQMHRRTQGRTSAGAWGRQASSGTYRTDRPARLTDALRRIREQSSLRWNSAMMRSEYWERKNRNNLNLRKASYIIGSTCGTRKRCPWVLFHCRTRLVFVLARLRNGRSRKHI